MIYIFVCWFSPQSFGFGSPPNPFPSGRQKGRKTVEENGPRRDAKLPTNVTKEKFLVDFFFYSFSLESLGRIHLFPVKLSDLKQYSGSHRLYFKKIK